MILNLNDYCFWDFVTFKDEKPNICEGDHNLGDGFCDKWLNNEENCYDNGDCCGKNVSFYDCYGSNDPDCACIDPNHKP